MVSLCYGARVPLAKVLDHDGQAYYKGNLAAFGLTAVSPRSHKILESHCLEQRGPD